MLDDYLHDEARELGDPDWLSLDALAEQCSDAYVSLWEEGIKTLPAKLSA